MTLTPLTETAFDDALSSFRTFLDSQGRTEQIVWTFLEDVYSRNTNTFPTRFWIRLPTPGNNDDLVKQAYRLAQERNVGLGFSAYAKCEDGLCCTVIIPKDDEDAQYLMLSPEAIRYSVVQDMPNAVSVRSRIKWTLFSLVPFAFKRGNHVVHLQSKRDLWR